MNILNAHKFKNNYKKMLMKIKLNMNIYENNKEKNRKRKLRIIMRKKI